MLESISFPFIVEFFKTLKDELNIYFLMEYIKGIDLFDAIRQLGYNIKYFFYEIYKDFSRHLTPNITWRQ